jgi:hypothetical protein
MTKRIATAVAVLGTAGMISGCFEQPSAGCVVQDAPDWTAKYTLTDKSKEGESCGKLTGEQIGVFKYINPNATAEDRAQNKVSRLAIRPNGQASLNTFVYPIQDTNKDGTPAFYPNGKPKLDTHEESRLFEAGATPADATNMSTSFTEEPDPKGVCEASGFPQTRVAAKDIVFTPPHGFGDEVRVPAQTAEYLFKKVEVYSDPSAPGTVLRGTLEYGDGTGCKAEYEVVAMWPTVACETDADCGEGSGLNPDFSVKCDTTLNKVVVVDEEDYGRTKIYSPGVCTLTSWPSGPKK